MYIHINIIIVQNILYTVVQRRCMNKIYKRVKLLSSNIGQVKDWTDCSERRVN